jgi:hypothetical protein
MTTTRDRDINAAAIGVRRSLRSIDLVISDVVSAYTTTPWWRFLRRRRLRERMDIELRMSLLRVLYEIAEMQAHQADTTFEGARAIAMLLSEGATSISSRISDLVRSEDPFALGSLGSLG